MNLYEIDARIMEAFEAAVDEETHAQCFLPHHFHRFGNADCRVIIKIERASISGNRTAANCNFYSSHVIFFWDCKLFITNHTINYLCFVMR